MTASRDEIVVGVDLGGTKIEAVVVHVRPDGDFDVLARDRTDTRASEGYDAVLESAATVIARVEASAGVRKRPIGVGMPGGVRRSDGAVKNSNATCLNGRPFREDLRAKLRRAIAFENDANCFALAEATLGAARAYRDGVVFGVIMGTGVGGGVVLHGRPWPGLHGIAGEWGHHPVRFGDDAEGCYCGQRGCLERYASGPALEARYAKLSGQRRSAAEIAGLHETDPHARAALSSVCEAFGRGLATLVDVLDPSCVVLGGGLSNVELLYTEGVAAARAQVFNDELLTPVVKNALGDSAGVLGAAMLVAGDRARVV